MKNLEKINLDLFKNDQINDQRQRSIMGGGCGRTCMSSTCQEGCDDTRVVISNDKGDVTSNYVMTMYEDCE